MNLLYSGVPIIGGGGGNNSKIDNLEGWSKWGRVGKRSHVYFNELLSQFLAYAKKKSDKENNEC